VAPGYRLEKTEVPTTGAESAMGIGRLEGWVSRKSDRLATRSLRALPYENFRKMQDMAADDLAFFKDRLARDTALYIEEELQQVFGPMLAFFKAAEEIGIHAVHFRETAQARAEVHALLKSN
jgi:hypothetical protein